MVYCELEQNEKEDNAAKCTFTPTVLRETSGDFGRLPGATREMGRVGLISWEMPIIGPSLPKDLRIHLLCLATE